MLSVSHREILDGLPLEINAVSGSYLSTSEPKFLVRKLPPINAHNVSHDPLLDCDDKDALTISGYKRFSAKKTSATTPNAIIVVIIGRQIGW